MIPKPCAPVRSSLGKRRLYTRSLILASIGVLLLTFGGSWRREFYAPGGLVEPHAQILGGALRNERCAACHPAARGRFSDWFGSGGEAHAGVSQSDLCMDCHHALAPRENATLAHNLTPKQLLAVTKSLGLEKPDAFRLASQSSLQIDAIECASCHREHHGKQADLRAVSNKQCQTCHSIQFNSLADGHPNWDQWPYGRGGSIAFNHASHKSEYFTKDGKAFECRSCHAIDAVDEIERSSTFAGMCASCHEQPLNITAAEGFVLLGFPTLGGDSLKEKNIPLGAWPSVAVGVDQFRIPPLTHALLVSDPQAKLAIDILLDPNITNVREPLSETSMRAMAIVAEAIRRLVQAMSVDPASELNRRLNSDLAENALGQLHQQMLSEVKDAWLGSESGKEIAEPERLPRGGWVRDDQLATVRYQGRGHADEVLRSLSELAVNPQLKREVRDLIAQIPAVSACLECHPNPMVNQTNSVANAAWKSMRIDSDKRTFTKFLHRPHLNLPTLDDCELCHNVATKKAIDQNVVKVAAYNPNNPHRSYEREFYPLTRSLCANCHTSMAAGDGCTKCHNYHIESLKIAMPLQVEIASSP